MRAALGVRTYVAVLGAASAMIAAACGDGEGRDGVIHAGGVGGGGAGGSVGGTSSGGALGGAGTGGDPGGGPPSTPCSATEVASAPAALRTDGRHGAFDLEGSPRFGWQVRSVRQTAYEVRVSATPSGAEEARGDVWSSGKVASSQQNGVVYAGGELEAGHRYYWTARTWDVDDRASCWSEVSSFGVGLGATWSHSTPIWAAPALEGWGDATLRARVTVDQVALGLRFRSPDNDNGYMWQLRGADNQLVPHVLQAGKYTALKTVSLPAGTLALGKEVEVTIAAEGSTITTTVDGALVDTTSHAAFARGGVGVRTGNSESGKISELTVTSSAGESPLATTFAAGDRSFGCGEVVGGALQVPTSASCLNRGMTADWAFLRQEITLRAAPVAATLFATAADARPAKQYVYKAYVNGSFVGLGPTQSIDDEARYDGFDVTEQLEAGRNVLGMLAYTKATQKLQAELWVTYDDGTHEAFGTDDGWGALSGEEALPPAGSIGTAVYEAPRENVDARRFPEGWSRVGEGAQSFGSAQAKPPFARLVAAPISKVAEQRHAPVRITQKAPGHFFIDFGRTWVGGVHYEIGAGEAGKNVELRFGEVTSAVDTVRYALNTGNEYRDVLTLKDGPQSFDTWGMRVFRYLEVIGAPEPITSENLQALALVYPFDREAATFDSSDSDLVRVWQLAKDTIEAVNVNFYTDSWTRERINYEADAYLQLLSSLALSDDAALGLYSIDYFQSQRTWPTEWPLYVILAVHDAWQRTGDTAQLRASYPSLQAKLPEAWLSSATGLVGKAACSDGASSATDCDLVDWPKTERDGYEFRHHNTVVNALAHRAYRDMAAIAEALENSADAVKYTDRADTLRAAINRHLYEPSGGRYDDGMDVSGNLTGHYSLHASAFALAFGVPTELEAPRVAASVAGRGMACSVYCAAFLIDGLFAAGRSGAALDLLTSSEQDSWLNMLRLGAGATAEAWDPSLKPNLSYSHPWAASPAFTIPTGLFGIRPVEPGYARVSIRPSPADLEQAAISVPTVRGPLAVAFAHSGTGELQVAVRSPGNMAVDLSMPVSDRATALYVDGVAKELTSDEVARGYALVPSLEAGCHVVTLEPPQPLHGAVEALCAP